MGRNKKYWFSLKPKNYQQQNDNWAKIFHYSLEWRFKGFSKSVRKHWDIENRLHWVLDVTFKEDDSRARRDKAAENLAVIRHVALNWIRNDKTVKAGVKSKRYRAYLMPECAEKPLNYLFWCDHGFALRLYTKDKRMVPIIFGITLMIASKT